MARDPSAQRDAQLRLVRRLRVGLVSAGVAGSLGVAAVTAADAPVATSGDASPRSVQPAQVGGGTSGDDDFSGWQDDAGESDGGQAQPQAPGLQQGFGRSHGSTSGS